MATTDADVPFRILPKLTDLNRGFWTGGEQGELRFLRCQDCGYYNHPPTPLCPICHSKHLASEAVSGKATLFTYAVNHQPWMPGPELPFVMRRGLSHRSRHSERRASRRAFAAASALGARVQRRQRALGARA